jgi:hypothetical protein
MGLNSMPRALVNQISPMDARVVSRSALVAELRARLERDMFPRTSVTFMLALAGLAAWVANVAMLHTGLDSMAVGYGLSALAGYGAFLVLVWLWIGANRGWSSLDTGGDLVGDGAGEFLQSEHGLGSGGPDVDVSGGVDLDALLLALLALLLVLGGLVALLYVVSTAPLLLAEAALDAALVASLSSRLRRDDAQSWVTGVVRRTAIPAGALVVCVALAGFVFGMLAPDARSIGGVVRELFG